MKIAIDITSLLDQYAQRGIGVYTKNIVKELVKFSSNEWHLIGYLEKEKTLKILELDEARCPNIFFHSLGPVYPSSVLSNVTTDRKIKDILQSINPDIYFVPNFEHTPWRGRWKTIVMIHDLIPLHSKKFSAKGPIFNILKGWFYKNKLKKAAKSNHIITNSEYSKSEIVRMLKVLSGKVSSIYLGKNPEFEPNENNNQNTLSILKSMGIESDYLIYYGGIESNKNVEYLIEVFKYITKSLPKLKLIIANPHIKGKNAFNNEAKKLLHYVRINKLTNKIIFPGEVGSYLPILVSKSKGFIHLSKYEGFGLAVLEALQCGTSVFISDIPVYRELFNGGAEFITLRSPEDAALQIINAIDRKTNPNKIENNYSWKDTAFKTIEVFEKIAKKENINKQIKVAFVAPYFFPYKGGAEKYSFDIARQLVENGFSVESYSSRFEKGQLTHEKKFGIDQYRLWTMNNAYYLRFYPALLFYILKSKADIFHAQGFGFIWQDFCMLIKKFFSIRKAIYICTPHGPFMARNNYTKSQLNLKKIFTSLQKKYLNYLYDVVLAVNPDQINWIHEEYGINLNKIKVLPIGIDSEHFDSQNYINTEVEINPKSKIVGTFVGRFHEYKGIIDLIQALYNSKYKKKILFFLMGQDAGLLSKMQLQIKQLNLENTIHIFLSPTDQKRNELLSMSEFFVFPSEWEAYGIAILEAMAHKNAIISTHTEGGKHLVQDNINGYLYNYGDIESLTSKIDAIIENEELRIKMQKNSYSKAIQLEWSKVWPEYLSLYNSINTYK